MVGRIGDHPEQTAAEIVEHELKRAEEIADRRQQAELEAAKRRDIERSNRPAYKR